MTTFGDDNNQLMTTFDTIKKNSAFFFIRSDRNNYQVISPLQERGDLCVSTISRH